MNTTRSIASFVILLVVVCGLATAQSAAVATLGVGDGVGDSAPLLISTLPKVGQAVHISAENLAPGGAAAYLFSLPVDLPWVLGSSQMWIDASSFVFAGPVSPKPDGSLFTLLPLPEIPELVGLQLNVQVASLVPPDSDIGPFQIEVTNGLGWTIGK